MSKGGEGQQLALVVSNVVLVSPCKLTTNLDVQTPIKTWIKNTYGGQGT